MPDHPPFRIKICGLSTPATLDAALDAGADTIGLVHFPRSPRHVPVADIAALAAHARGRAAIWLLTVDADDDLLDALIDAARPDVLQLHGREAPERVAALRARTGVAVAKALGIGSAADLDEAKSFAGVADHLLFDAKPPKHATRPGGLGEPFDWSLLDVWPRATPFLLSGGLGPTNVGEAIRRVRPAGVDVSSGVESAPGVKDADLIRSFVTAARAAAILSSEPA